MLLEQAIAFLTDPVGLERTLRFVHALLLITVNSPLLLGIVAAAVMQPAKGDGAVNETVVLLTPILRGILARISLTRVFFRAFRFLDNFYDAHQLVMSLVSGDSNKTKTTPRALIPWLDAASRFCIAVFFATDLLLVADALDVPGLVVWAPSSHRRLRRVSQQHWFLSLAASVAAGVLRLVAEPVVVEEVEAVVDDSSDSSSSSSSSFVRSEQKRLRRLAHSRRRQHRAWLRAARARLLVLGRRLLADACDLFLPGANLGWLPVRQPRTIGMLMVVSTALTAWEVWDRCGRTVTEAKAAKDAKKAEETNKKEEPTENGGENGMAAASEKKQN